MEKDNSLLNPLFSQTNTFEWNNGAYKENFLVEVEISRRKIHYTFRKERMHEAKREKNEFELNTKKLLKKKNDDNTYFPSTIALNGKIFPLLSANNYLWMAKVLLTLYLETSYKRDISSLHITSFLVSTLKIFFMWAIIGMCVYMSV